MIVVPLYTFFVVIIPNIGRVMFFIAVMVRSIVVIGVIGIKEVGVVVSGLRYCQ